MAGLSVAAAVNAEVLVGPPRFGAAALGVLAGAGVGIATGPQAAIAIAANASSNRFKLPAHHLEGLIQQPFQGFLACVEFWRQFQAGLHGGHGLELLVLF